MSFLVVLLMVRVLRDHLNHRYRWICHCERSNHRRRRSTKSGSGGKWKQEGDNESADSLPPAPFVLSLTYALLVRPPSSLPGGGGGSNPFEREGCDWQLELLYLGEPDGRPARVVHRSSTGRRRRCHCRRHRRDGLVPTFVKINQAKRRGDCLLSIVRNNSQYIIRICIPRARRRMSWQKSAQTRSRSILAGKRRNEIEFNSSLL